MCKVVWIPMSKEIVPLEAEDGKHHDKYSCTSVEIQSNRWTHTYLTILFNYVYQDGAGMGFRDRV